MRLELEGNLAIEFTDAQARPCSGFFPGRLAEKGDGLGGAPEAVAFVKGPVSNLRESA